MPHGEAQGRPAGVGAGRKGYRVVAAYDVRVPVFFGVVMTLAEWLKQSGTSQSELARRLDVTRAAVNTWVHGKVSPGVFYALAIEAASGGDVDLRSWLSARDRAAVDGMRKKVDAAPPHG